MSIGVVSNALSEQSKGVPKPILTLAALRLLPDDLARTTPQELKDLDALLLPLTGSTVQEIREVYGTTDDRLIVLAELYGILDYQEGVRTRLLAKLDGSAGESGPAERTALRQRRGTDQDSVGASLQLCVQHRFEDAVDAVCPAKWFESCDLFWEKQEVEPNGGQQAIEGVLKLPEGDAESGIPVTVHVDVARDKFKITHRYRIVRDGGGEICRGVLDVRKEIGRPGASRITHEKRARFDGGPLFDFGEETLRYWVQAETLCLVLPP